MHECPWCFEVCDCDGTEEWQEAWGDCAHECEEEVDTGSMDYWASITNEVEGE
jgi:hypothetical protein